MRRLAVISFVLLGLILNAGRALAHDNQAQAAPKLAPEVTRALTGLRQRLLDLHARQQKAADLEAKVSALRELVAVAAARQERLAALVEQDPGAAIQSALPAATRAALPREVAPYLEEDVTVDGELDVLHEDTATGSRYVHWLKLGDTRLSMHFADTAPALSTGDRVRVRALRVQQALALGSSNQVSVLASAVPNTFGAQQTAVFLVSFSNQPSVVSASPATAQSTVFNGSQSVSSFFYETSYQQTWLTGSVFGPYVISISGASSSCDYYGIATQVEAKAVADGVDLSSYRRRVYAFPDNACGWWGLGTIGGNPSMAWINGSFQNSVVAHEMGHNLGLYHSHALECGSATLASSCTSVEYGDTLDTMGSASPPKHYNAAQKERLGWLNYGSSPPVTAVQADGVYSIDPYESVGSNPKALKVRTPSGDWYYVEYRQPIGFDASTVSGNTNVRNGVVVHLMDNGNPDGIFLLDMTPASASWFDPALGVNQTFTDTAAGISISPVWANASNAGVNITLGGGCVAQSPTVTVSPSQQQGGPGVAVSYTVSVTNNDSACPAATFAPQATLPGTGWTASYGVPSFSIAPGGTAATTVVVKAPTAVAAGSYGIAMKASNVDQPTYAAGSSATYVVPAPCVRKAPTLSLTPAQQQGAPGQPMTYTVSVSNQDTACGSSSFSLQATAPAGWAASYAPPSLTLAAGGAGTSTLSVTPPAGSAAGTFTVALKTVNTAATTFTASGSAKYVVPAACTRQAPGVTVTPAQRQGAPGQTVTYSLSVVNRDATSCSTASFTPQATVPSGWTASYAPAALSLAPGASATTTLSVTPPAGVASGTYALTLAASNAAAPTYAASGGASYLVPQGGGGTGSAGSFTDNFGRADSTTLGNGWVEVSGDLMISGGELRTAPIRAHHRAVVPTLAGGTLRAAASFASLDNNISPRFGLIVRYRDPKNYYTCYRQTGGVSALRIAKVVNGAEIVLKSMPIANPFKNALFAMTCRAEGSSLTLELGSARLSASDATFATGSVGLVMGYPGSTTGNAPSHRADTFSATAQ